LPLFWVRHAQVSEYIARAFSYFDHHPFISVGWLVLFEPAGQIVFALEIKQRLTQCL
jgi:hypothetical protein